MYNDFVIIGPADDPAKIKGIKSANDAFKKLLGRALSLFQGAISPELIQKSYLSGRMPR